MPGKESQKTCRKCGETKPIGDFPRYAASGNPAGSCRECDNAASRRYRAANRKRVKVWKDRDYARNRERQIALKKTKREADPERAAAIDKKSYDKHRDKRLAQKKAYHEANREKRNAYNARYRSDPVNAQKARERTAEFRRNNPSHRQEWSDANPDLIAKYQRTRRARLYDAFVAEVIEDDIIQRDLGLCGICGEPVVSNYAVTLDHIVPLAAGVAAGGTHEPKNIQLAHRSCNSRKRDRLDFELRR